MKTRDEIITSMCYTYRHDYGLEKTYEGYLPVSGMTAHERTALYNTMAQIFDNVIAPNMEFKREPS